MTVLNGLNIFRTGKYISVLFTDKAMVCIADGMDDGGVEHDNGQRTKVQ